MEENEAARGIIELRLLLFGLGRECNYWDGPLGLALVLCELRVERRLLCEDSVSLFTSNFLGAYVNGLVSNLDLDIWVGFEIVVPVGIGGGSSLRSEDNIAVAGVEVHHRISPGLAGAGPFVIDKQQGRALELAAYLSMVLAELRNNPRVPIAHRARQKGVSQGDLMTSIEKPVRSKLSCRLRLLAVLW